MTEAERLAAELDAVPENGADPELIADAAAELRRLEAECEQLHFELELCGQLKRGYQEQAAQAMAECEQLRADAARLAYLFKHDSEWALCVFDHDGGYWIHDARTPDVVRADIDAAMKETK